MEIINKNRWDNKILLVSRRIPGIVVITVGIIWKFAIDIILLNISSSPISTVVDNIDYFHFFIALFVAPPIETLFFQLAPIELFERLSTKLFHKRYPLLASCFSAILFGSVHSISYLSVISASLTGLALSNTYLIFKYRHHKIIDGFFMTLLLHFIVNLIINIGRILT